MKFAKVLVFLFCFVLLSSAVMAADVTLSCDKEKALINEKIICQLLAPEDVILGTVDFKISSDIFKIISVKGGSGVDVNGDSTSASGVFNNGKYASASDGVKTKVLAVISLTAEKAAAGAPLITDLKVKTLASFSETEAKAYAVELKPWPVLDFSATAPCAEKWSCGAWSVCEGGSQTRACTDDNKCGTTTNKPVEKQSCTATVSVKPGDVCTKAGDAAKGEDGLDYTCIDGGQGLKWYVWFKSICKATAQCVPSFVCDSTKKVCLLDVDAGCKTDTDCLTGLMCDKTKDPKNPSCQKPAGGEKKFVVDAGDAETQKLLEEVKKSAQEVKGDNKKKFSAISGIAQALKNFFKALGLA